MMSTCKTCRYWELCAKTDEHPTHGTCSNSKFIYVGDDSMILNEETGLYEYENKGDDTLLYRDAECYSAVFFTGPNFGCTHHEGKV